MTIKLLGNEKSKIEKFFNNFSKYNLACNIANKFRTDINGDLVPDDLVGIEIELDNFTKGLFKSYLEDIPYGKHSLEYSSFFDKRDKAHFPNWHNDKLGKFYGMLISAFPNPTYVLKANSREVDYSSTNCFIPDSDIDEMVKAGKAEVIVPKPGDIYFLSGDTIHKANPASAKPGGKHLCLRVWIV